ncbi:MAG: DUF1285 domain-containing protein [Gammaproteobacteria bacterium]|nr:DUF1285 domain-containing protein [Gammaproteobacteria bacterium]MBT8151288.1 DUF1285 domain-containing protein [Gammaproteobacteria bacterium]NND38726.1 DUF1285 domain-containing protein [Pseudomonadales bacterium]NNM12190.1 DUF1285 domain-containing protein [Pseudomonadales bacterium]RZV57595.1 MAG: DUF1285 domain-containing protein [Pseudomonadales bacterium]
MHDELDKIFNAVPGESSANTRKGRIDITIHSSGAWSYRGTPIERPEMVKLFASQLICDGGHYYLRAPEQLLRIRVEDLPFLVVQLDIDGDGEQQRPEQQELSIVTNCGDKLCVGEAHPLVLLPKASAEFENAAGASQALPAVLVRDGLYARFSRNTYYQLIERAEPATSPGDEAQLFVRSCGIKFPLGQC